MPKTELDKCADLIPLIDATIDGLDADPPPTNATERIRQARDFLNSMADDLTKLKNVTDEGLVEPIRNLFAEVAKLVGKVTELEQRDKRHAP